MMNLLRTSIGWHLVDDRRCALLPEFSLDGWLANPDPLAALQRRAASLSWTNSPPTAALLPVESQEIWAAGVTYLRSKAARMEESDFSATAYDRVYDAPRPELFFKATPRRCAGPFQPLRLRSDSRWMVPEPELALVISASGQIIGFTIGNDLSSRDIEGENLLYLPQAKVWDGCCALGPTILLNQPGLSIRDTAVRLSIDRAGQTIFSGETRISQIKRPFEQLVEYLFRHQSFPHGVLLLTGTGIVPPDSFTLHPADEVRISVDSIGELVNPVLA